MEDKTDDDDETIPIDLPPLPVHLIKEQDKYLSTLSTCLTSLLKEKDFSYDKYHFTKFLHKFGLDLSDTVSKDPWDSLVASFLQNACQDFILDGVDDLLPLHGELSARLEIQIQKCKRLAGNPTWEQLLEAITKKTAPDEQISQILEEISQIFGVVIKPILFESSASLKDQIDQVITTLNISIIDEADANKKPLIHCILWYDPVAKAFHNIVLRELMFENVQNYCDQLLADLIENEDFTFHHMKNMTDIEILDITKYIELQLAPLSKITKTSDFIDTLVINDTELEDHFSLQTLKARGDQLSSETLDRLKQQFMFSLKHASDLTLQQREAAHRDKIRALVAQEEDMIKENDRLEEEEKAAEAEKQRKIDEIKELERQIAQKEENKANLEALIAKKNAELEQTAKNLEYTMGKIDYNQLKKDLMNLEPPYGKNQASNYSQFQSLSTLKDIISKVYAFYGNVLAVKNSTAFWKYVAANDTPTNRTEILGIIKNVLMQEPKLSHNSNDSSILEVTGRQLVTSQVWNSVQHKNFRELRIIAGKILYIDSDFAQTSCHGKNIVLASPEIEVKGNGRTINVSGNSSKSSFPAHARSSHSASGRHGMDGLDGDAGESSGHVTIRADKVRNGKGLSIYTNGGNGADGQSGEDGMAGRDGNNGYNPTDGAPGKGQTGHSTGNVARRGTPGSTGQSGGNGGRAGLGGGGGNKGEISILVSAPSHGIKVENTAGKIGQDGKPGKGAQGGQGGINGVDLLWLFWGYGIDGSWTSYRGTIGSYSRKEHFGRSFLQGLSFGITGKWYDWNYHMLGPPPHRATNGQYGNQGLNAAQRAHQRKTATAKKAVNNSEVSNLYQSVRNMYGTTASVEQGVSQSLNEKAKLEQQQSNLTQERLNAANNVKRLEEEIKAATESKTAAQAAKAKLEEEIRINLQNQKQVEANLKKLAIERTEVEKSTILQKTQTVGSAIEQMFEQQKQESRSEMQRRTMHQHQTNIITDFQEKSKDESEKEVEYKTHHDEQMESLYDEVRLVKNIHKLSDEFFTLALASRAKDPKQAEAFELGMQEIKSFSQQNKLPVHIRGYLESRSTILETSSNSSSKKLPPILSVEYLRDQLPEDVKITMKTQEWLVENPEFRNRIFRTLEYHGASLGEFYFC